MDLAPWMIASGMLAGLIGGLWIWQRRLDRSRAAAVEAEIEESRARGTAQAIAQHPQVDPLLCIGCGSCVAACPEDGVLGLAHGVAKVIHVSRCVGHAKCMEACPVGAITVGLGDVRSRSDVPVLASTLETSVPGVYIAGELGGWALIRHAIHQGAQVTESIAAALRPSRASGSQRILDVLIVGAGPAGLSAGLKARELGLNALTIDQDEMGGTIRKYPRQKLTLVQQVEIPLHGKLPGGEYAKEELIELWESILRAFPIRIERPVKLLGIRREGPTLLASTSRGDMLCRAVVLALGRRGTPRRLGVPGEESEKVLYQLLDASSYSGKRILIVGGGDSAVEAALGLSNQPGNAVHLSYRKEGFFRLKSRNQERIRDALARGRVQAFFSSEVTRIEAESVALRVEKTAGRSDTGEPQGEEIVLPNDHVFVFAGGEPPFPLLQQIGVRFWGKRAATSGPMEKARA